MHYLARTNIRKTVIQMAHIEKLPSGSYRFTAYDGGGKKKHLTWKPTQGLTARQLEKEVQRQATLFEEQARHGQTAESTMKLSEFYKFWHDNYAIYDMLLEYPGKVTVYIDGLAGSAASVVAMAGEEVVISPVSCIMIHNPATLAIGDSEEMQRAAAMLDEVKESIMNAYAMRTGIRRSRISDMMTAETWMNARKAVELKFADRIGTPEDGGGDAPEPMIFSRAAVTNSLLSKIQPKKQPPSGKSITAAYERLNLLTGGSHHVKTA